VDSADAPVAEGALSRHCLEHLCVLAGSVCPDRLSQRRARASSNRPMTHRCSRQCRESAPSAAQGRINRRVGSRRGSCRGVGVPQLRRACEPGRDSAPGGPPHKEETAWIIAPRPRLVSAQLPAAAPVSALCLNTAWSTNGAAQGEPQRSLGFHRCTAGRPRPLADSRGVARGPGTPAAFRRPCGTYAASQRPARRPVPTGPASRRAAVHLCVQRVLRAAPRPAFTALHQGRREDRVDGEEGALESVPAAHFGCGCSEPVPRCRVGARLEQHFDDIETVSCARNVQRRCPVSARRTSKSTAFGSAPRSSSVLIMLVLCTCAAQ